VKGDLVAEVITSDGVRLCYQDAGSGRPLLIVPGFSAAASMFARQVEGLRDRYRVIVYDHRGHGRSGKPRHGYRIARLAKDLDDLLESLDLDDVNLLGWSMGCSVVWSYYDLFGPERLARLILVEGHAFLCGTLETSEQEAAEASAVFDPAAAAEFAASFRNDQQAVVRRLAALFGADTDVDWLVEEMLKLPRAAAAALMFDHLFNDWRDLIPRIRLPTLIVGGGRSHVPVSAQRWLHRTIRGSQLVLLPDCRHLLFYEDPGTFNELVARFIG
jgi:non-heme chloroperoxidase